jgi:epoxyqueuosine reductase QueG
MKDTKVIEVCDKCFRACCWHGLFMCDESRNAGTVFKTIKELKKLNLEHESNWNEV